MAHCEPILENKGRKVSLCVRSFWINVCVYVYRFMDFPYVSHTHFD
jgi:hypothetical protein